MSPKDQNSAWRMFVAVALPEHVKSQLAVYIDQLKSRVQGVKASWDRPDKAHITLKFLGNIDPQLTGALSEAAERAASDERPFELTVEGTGTFPARGQARVLWLGITDRSGSLTRLQRRLDDQCAAAGFAKEDRAFHPHLTVARLRLPANSRELATLHRASSFASNSFNVKSIIVIRSELSPSGSKYTTISEHCLKQ